MQSRNLRIDSAGVISETTCAMLYYTIYIKNLHNGTGYMDVALEDDQLLKDFSQFLDIGVRPHRAYAMTNPGAPDGSNGHLVINISEVLAITVATPK